MRPLCHRNIGVWALNYLLSEWCDFRNARMPEKSMKSTFKITFNTKNDFMLQLNGSQENNIKLKSINFCNILIELI